MIDPYEVLGLEPGADEATVRQRYLELVRRFTPNQSPARFAEIHAAYDQLKDPIARLEQQLFNINADDSLEQIMADMLERLRAERIPLDTLLSLAED